MCVITFMKRIITPLFALVFMLSITNSQAQKHTPLPHGMVFGSAPSNIGRMPASNMETFMGKRTRTSAVIIGRVLKVTKPKGGWFDIDAGQGKIIAAHFSNYNITIPTNLKGREVIVEGVAAKEFVADDMQPMAGETKGQMHQQHQVKTNPKQRLTFEVKGLYVNK